MSDAKEKNYYAYLVQCIDTSLYAGWTQDLEKRLVAHNLGVGAKYTRSRRPVDLVASWEFDTRSEAMKFEFYLKRLSRQEKLNLISQG